ncbi:MAG: WbqC family protein, partial [Bacteroidota bacterium]
DTMQTTILSLHYLPCLDFFTEWIRADKVLIEAHESFQKQTYRNRCYTLQTNKKMLLSIPVKKGSQQLNITDVEIDYKNDWNNLHWRSIKSAYRRTPFFEFYADEFQEIFENPPQKLFDFNLKLLTICLEALGASTDFEQTTAFQHSYPDVVDLRTAISPKKADRFSYTPYWQVFGNDFIANLSILDLLFSKGPETKQHLLQAVLIQ